MSLVPVSYTHLFKIDRITREAGFQMKTSHVHPFYDITYLINGECTCFVNHSIYKLSKGDLIIIPPGDIHRSTFHGKIPVERYVLSLSLIHIYINLERYITIKIFYM